MSIGTANPPPGSGGTNPDGSIDTPATEAPTPTEPPAPWTPPEHWPPMPEGLTPAQVADWILRNRSTDAVLAQTEQLRAASEAAAGLNRVITDAQFALAIFAACADSPMTPAAVRARCAALLPDFRKLVPSE